MENKEINKLVDFCIFCGKLANLVPHEESKDKSVIWDKWNKKSLSIRYKEELFGIKIEINEKKRHIKEERKKNPI